MTKLNQASDKSQRCPQWIFWVLLIALGLAAMGFMRYLTPQGMGLANDSVGYIGGARSLAAGDGYSRLKGNGTPAPITNTPPLFSILLAGISFFGPDPIHGALLLNVLLFGVNVVLMGVLVRRATGNGLWGLAGAVFFTASAPIFRTHTYAMSEPLYFLMSFLTIWFYLQYTEKNRWGWLAISGIAASLTFLTRYVAVSVYVTVLLGLLLFSTKEKGRRVDWPRFGKEAGIFLASGIPLVLVWLVRNFLVSQNPGNRQLLWHPIREQVFRDGMMNFWGWLLPETGGVFENNLEILSGAFFVLLGALVVGTILRWMRYQQGRIAVREKEFIAGWFFTVYGLVYLATIVFTMTFLDASSIFDDRLLTPFYISLLVVFTVLLSWIWNRKKWVWSAAAVILSLGLLLSFTEDALDAVAVLRQDGQVFSESKWRDSEVIAAVRDLPADLTLYSNKINAIYLLTGKPAYVVPSPLNPATRLPIEGYSESMENIHQSVLAGKAIIAIFHYDLLTKDPEDADWMADIAAGMPVLEELADGVIFGIDPENR